MHYLDQRWSSSRINNLFIHVMDKLLVYLMSVGKRVKIPLEYIVYLNKLGHHWFRWSSLVQIMTYGKFGVKTLSEPMPGCCQLDPWEYISSTMAEHLTIIGSDNGLSPSRRQPIIWTNDGILLIRPLGKKLQWNFNRNPNIFIRENAFEIVVCEMVAILSRPQWDKTHQYPCGTHFAQVTHRIRIAWLGTRRHEWPPTEKTFRLLAASNWQVPLPWRTGKTHKGPVEQINDLFYLFQGSFCVCAPPMRDDVTL